ncbi:hypothetical protein [Enterobacter hormaechei]|uniref:hypothetical protein n=1 Tax=Enterobacter hormaechei TaxID=158836 RepID=UPI0020B6CEDF|nr:hypothetical protein [Enterobacter hormaechei]UTI09446.1 hypothetical protein LZ581_22925 [Enterobacter hormaechei subsp. steigerwaltii]
MTENIYLSVISRPAGDDLPKIQMLGNYHLTQGLAFSVQAAASVFLPHLPLLTPG